jgi:uncharacterized protein
MVIGVVIIELHLPSAHSLKDKRSIVKSITSRINREFNVSCAEVEHQEVWQTAGIGAAVISNSAVHAQQVLGSVLGWIERNRPDVQIVDHSIEMI